MQFLKSFILKFSFLLFFTFLVSCSNTVNFDNIIAKDQAFTTTIIIKTNRSMLGDKTIVQVEPDSKDYIKFLEWLNHNSSGWNKSIASFEKQNVITQNDFELFYMGYFVSISYKDAEGKSHHLNKTVEIGSLDFLFD